MARRLIELIAGSNRWTCKAPLVVSVGSSSFEPVIQEDRRHGSALHTKGLMTMRPILEDDVRTLACLLLQQSAHSTMLKTVSELRAADLEFAKLVHAVEPYREFWSDVLDQQNECAEQLYLTLSMMMEISTMQLQREPSASEDELVAASQHLDGLLLHEEPAMAEWLQREVGSNAVQVQGSQAPDTFRIWIRFSDELKQKVSQTHHCCLGFLVRTLDFESRPGDGAFSGSRGLRRLDLTQWKVRPVQAVVKVDAVSMVWRAVLQVSPAIERLAAFVSEISVEREGVSSDTLRILKVEG